MGIDYKVLWMLLVGYKYCYKFINYASRICLLKLSNPVYLKEKTSIGIDLNG
jgi:hypothetical protein